MVTKHPSGNVNYGLTGLQIQRIHRLLPRRDLLIQKICCCKVRAVKKPDLSILIELKLDTLLGIWRVGQWSVYLLNIKADACCWMHLCISLISLMLYVTDMWIFMKPKPCMDQHWWRSSAVICIFSRVSKILSNLKPTKLCRFSLNLKCYKQHLKASIKHMPLSCRR